MNSNEYLDAAKSALNITSDYQIAKRFDVRKQEISKIRNDGKPLSVYLCTKIAIVLNTDPATVIADIEAQSDKNPTRAAFWQSFLCAVRKNATKGILAAICIGGLLLGQNALGGDPSAFGKGFLVRRRCIA